MIKIAFTSCMLQQRFENQAVWSRIQACNPDYLVLLGDSVYLDIDVDPKRMSDDEFGTHAHTRYRAQLEVPEFDTLLRFMSLKGGRRTFAIWDDHDFLWNDSGGAAIAKIPQHRDKIPRTTAIFRAFQNALVTVGTFPDRFEDIFPPQVPAPSRLYESVELSDGTRLHLTDGRTYRTETFLVAHKARAILGKEQLAWLAAQVEAAPSDVVHLVASGSTSSSWKRYIHDWQALNAIADSRRTLMLSGDVHYNAFASHVDPHGLLMHEATASGAAIKDAVIVGSRVENFAIAEIEAASVRIRYFEKTGEKQSRTILRSSWTA
jgi:alkaline phosphatase D